jgi:hypothetical protein
MATHLVGCKAGEQNSAQGVLQLGDDASQLGRRVDRMRGDVNPGTAWTGAWMLGDNRGEVTDRGERLGHERAHHGGRGLPDPDDINGSRRPQHRRDLRIADGPADEAPRVRGRERGAHDGHQIMATLG